MTRVPYVIAPIFGVRPAGAPFDVLERLGTPAIAEAARRLPPLEAAAATAARDALAQLRLALPAPGGLRARLEKRIHGRLALAANHLDAFPALRPYDVAAAALRDATAALEALIEREYHRLHDVLHREAARELPDFLVFESESLADELVRMGVSPDGAALRSKDRKKDRALALYLQRVCAKNDTVSRFGPLAWGTIVDGEGVQVRPQPGVARRRVELERWVVKGLLEVINADPEARDEVCPRLHPHGRFDGDGFVRLDEDRAITLGEAERALAARCDGATPAAQLGDVTALARLVAAGVIRWELEPMARDASPLATLQGDVEGWRPGPAADRWRERLATLATLVRRFATDPTAPGRRQIVAELRARLDEIEVAMPASQRTLYAARNPINENCEQVGTITMGARSVEAMVGEVWPWFQLFSDAVAFAGARAYQRVHELIAAAPRRGGVLPYSTLVRVAREHGPGIDDDALHAAVGTEVFAEIKRDFTARLSARADAPAWDLTADDCGFLRRRHAFPLHGELASPSADLQVAVQDGHLQWLVAELHFPLVLVQHASYWSCPDKPALHAALAGSVEAHAFCARDAGNAAPVHVNSEGIIAAMPRTTYVGVGRTKPGWHVVRPADAQVVVDEERCDVRLRAPSGEDLGSIVRVPRLLVGMHPFFPFERGPHEPRLRVGNVIVQRQAWHVRSAALGEDRPTGVSAGFVARLERERADRGIPRWVFIRPAPGVLAPGMLVRDKDAKPMYVDLESVVFLDILERRLRKYGTLVLTEMLPTPEQLIWQQPEGRFTFEIRTNAVRVR